jgi:integrase
MLSEAERLGYIPINPAKQIKPIKNTVKERELITIEEVKRLFTKENVNEVWDNHLGYTANLLALTSGMRLGEVQGLQVADVHDTYVHVCHSLERGGFGLKDTKTHEKRMIPLPVVTLSALRELVKENNAGFVFSMNGGKDPVDPTTITKPLYKALKTIGISEADRKVRNITYHMWRHYFNSRLRSAGVPDSKIQLLTGHRTIKMVQHYTHFNVDDFSDILQANMW